MDFADGSMNVTLRDFTAADIEPCEQWAQAINVRQYQSRHHPRAFDGEHVLGDGLRSWFVIVVDGEDVGTVWLEKVRPDDDVAILGIMLGRNDLLGKGIGREAIRLAIDRSRCELHYSAVELSVRKDNPRAISCYRRCGFAIRGEGVKRTDDGQDVPFYSMVKHLKPTPGEA